MKIYIAVPLEFDVMKVFEEFTIAKLVGIWKNYCYFILLENNKKKNVMHRSYIFM